MVKAVASGKSRIESIEVSEKTLTEGTEMLEDLIRTAINNALEGVENKARETLGEMDTGNLDLSQFFK